MALQSAFKFNANELYSTLANMIISQQVFSNDLSLDNALVSRFKVDGTLYGDTKLFYSTNALKSYPWIQNKNGVATNPNRNVLEPFYPDDPKVQSICIDTYRQIPLTVSQYLGKRAFADEGSFTQFNSVMLGWITATKNLYEITMFQTYVGTTETNIGLQSQTLTLASGASGAANIEAENRINGSLIAKKVADIFAQLRDPIVGKKYNDYGFYRNYNPSDFIAVWNAEAVNQIEKIDLPTIFHKDGLVDKMGEYTMVGDYFGTRLNSTNISSYSDATPAAGKPIDSDDDSYVPGTNNANGKLCVLKECDITVSNVTTHLFFGEELPAGAILVAAGSEDLDAGKINYNDVYIVDNKTLFKLIHKDALKLMTAFETGSEFYNSRALDSTHYLTWGYSDPFNNAGSEGGIRLLNYPFITVKKA